MTTLSFSQQIGQTLRGPVEPQYGKKISMSADGKTTAFTSITLQNSDLSSPSLYTTHVSIYRLNTSNQWISIGNITFWNNTPVTSLSQINNSISLSGNGNIMAFGDPILESGSANNDVGIVRVYKYDGTNAWNRLGSPLTGNINSQFGFSNDLSDDGFTIAIGVPNENNIGVVRVYVYDDQQNIWNSKGNQLTVAGGSKYGHNVKISADGNTIIASGYVSASGNTNYITIQQWNINNSTWETKGFLALSGQPSNVIGERVLWLSPDGNYFAVGYPNANNNTGYVDIYSYNNTTGNWEQRGNTVSGLNSGNQFGSSLLLNADATSMIIGSPKYTSSGGITNAGEVTTYNFTNGWVRTFYMTNVGTTQDAQVGLGLASNTDLSVVAILENTGNVNVFESLNMIINFTTTANPIEVLRNQTKPADNYISSVTYGAFNQYSLPNSSVVVNGIPNNFETSGDYTVTYSILNSDAIVPSVSSNTTLYSIQRIISVSTAQYVAPICFYAGSKVLTDQGEIEIQNIIPRKHTIRNMTICDVTKVFNSESTMTLIEKNAFASGVPNTKTHVTNNHKIFYNNGLIPAKKLVGLICDNSKVSQVDYNGQPVYNVVLTEPSTMLVNNMNCETLHPRNIMYVRIKIQEEIANSKDAKRIAELKKQDKMIVDALNRQNM